MKKTEIQKALENAQERTGNYNLNVVFQDGQILITEFFASKIIMLAGFVNKDYAIGYLNDMND